MRTVFSNTVSQILAKIIGAGTTFIVSILLARHFGSRGYGDFVKVTTYISFFFLIADFGFNAVFLQRNRDTHAFPTLMGTRLIAAFGLIFLALSILVFIPRGLDRGYTDAVRLGIIVFSPAILFQALITTANALFQKHLRYGNLLLSTAAGSVLTLLSLWVLLAIAPYAAIAGPLAILAGSAAGAFVSLLLARKLTGSLSPIFSRESISPLVLTSLPLGATLLFTVIYGHIDSVILTLTRQTGEVGIYGLAYKVFELILVIPTFFMNATYPLLLTAAPDPVRFRKLFTNSFFFLGGASLVGTIGIWLTAPLLGVIQPEFAASAAPLRILALGFPLFFTTSLVMWTLIAMRRQQWLLLIYGMSMVINILANLWLIPRFGYMAAAWVTVGSELVVLCASATLFTRFLRSGK